MKKIFMNRKGRRQFIKTSLSGFALATLPGISFAQSNPDVVVRAVTDLFISPALG
jgi:hypothetical protein